MRLSVRLQLWKANQWPVWTSARIIIQQLTDDGTALVGSATTLITADQAWEQPLCVEAPWVVEREGMYYLFYSGSMVNWPLDTYAVGVARSR